MSLSCKNRCNTSENVFGMIYGPRKVIRNVIRVYFGMKSYPAITHKPNPNKPF